MYHKRKKHEKDQRRTPGSAGPLDTDSYNEFRIPAVDDNLKATSKPPLVSSATAAEPH